MNKAIFFSQLVGMSKSDIKKCFLKYNDSDEKLLSEYAVNHNIKSDEVTAAIEKTKRIEELCWKNHIKTVAYGDADFPERLKHDNSDILLLYYQGSLTKINHSSIAVIGTRNPSEWSKKIAECLGRVLGRDGYTIVSGLADGCDSYGHIGCLRANGYTVAVLPSGIDRIYPAKNKGLARDIIANDGCLLSEYPPGTYAKKYHFIQRDRVQAMLSDGIIVVECALKSGTMHTVRYARQYRKLIGCYIKDTNPDTWPEGNRELIQNKTACDLKNDVDLICFKNLLMGDTNQQYMVG